MKGRKKTSNAQRPTPNVEGRKALDIIELLDRYEDGDLIHLLARGIYREDLFRAECVRYLAENFYADHRITQIRHCFCRMIPRGERGDEYKIGNVRGRGTFEATIADIKYGEIAS